MTFLAFGAKWGVRGASGSVRLIVPSAARPSFDNKSPKAMAPSPPAHSRRNIRRLWTRRNSENVMLFPGNELVEVEKDSGDTEHALFRGVLSEDLFLVRGGFASQTKLEGVVVAALR